jgi:hypothetical protein
MKKTKDNIEQLKILASGKLGAKKVLLWNRQGTSTENIDTAPSPRNYWCARVAGQMIKHGETLGWPSRKQALEAAAKFQEKCISKLSDIDE